MCRERQLLRTECQLNVECEISVAVVWIHLEQCHFAHFGKFALYLSCTERADKFGVYQT